MYLSNIKIPELSYTHHVKTLKAYIFDATKVAYDVILRLRFLNKINIDVLSPKLKCSWYEDEVPFHPPDYYNNNIALLKVKRCHHTVPSLKNIMDFRVKYYRYQIFIFRHSQGSNYKNKIVKTYLKC